MKKLILLFGTFLFLLSNAQNPNAQVKRNGTAAPAGVIDLINRVSFLKQLTQFHA